ncbi:MAG: LytTR family DNA-binding domain-containing protein [Balneolaceae bacterium]|nr:LytTR family DNA-binding domain-containing protein [Balneolaceae bacterium]
MSNILSQPYPCEMSRRERAGITAGVSLFVVFFLAAFAPFGLDAYTPARRLLLSLGYGAACALAMTADYLLVMPALPGVFRESKWTVGRQIGWITWILLTIGLANSVFSAAVGVMPFDPYRVGLATLQVVAVGTFPVATLVLLDYLRLYRRHARRAGELQEKVRRMREGGDISQDEDRLQLVSRNRKERLLLQPGELLYLTAADNYVEVYYRVKGEAKTKLLRGTLKDFEKQADHPEILRCHRSWIVNLRHVVNLSGNAQGYRLSLRGADRAIPVSRSHADTVLERMDAR